MVLLAASLRAYPGERRSRDRPESNDATYPSLLYRSSLCPGEYIPGDDCSEDEIECDSRGHCTVVWCDGGEPDRCDAG